MANKTEHKIRRSVSRLRPKRDPLKTALTAYRALDTELKAQFLKEIGEEAPSAEHPLLRRLRGSIRDPLMMEVVINRINNRPDEESDSE